jgi:hypothetical protein
MLTREYVESILDYNSDTGVFTWRRRPDAPLWWNVRYAGQIAGGRDAHGYLTLRIADRAYKAHRVAWCCVTGSMPPADAEIDHVNGDRKDNRAANLRLADDQQNAANARIRKDNKSGFKGVSWHRRLRKWQAQINDGGKRRSLGYFDNPEAAKRAYDTRAREMHGEFARAA